MKATKNNTSSNNEKGSTKNWNNLIRIIEIGYKCSSILSVVLKLIHALF